MKLATAEGHTLSIQVYLTLFTNFSVVYEFRYVCLHFLLVFLISRVRALHGSLIVYCPFFESVYQSLYLHFD